MSKKKKIIIISALIAVVIGISATVYAASYNSASDPLVALSYITNIFRPSINKDIKSVSDKIAAAEERIAKIESDIKGGASSDTSALEDRLTKVSGELELIKKDMSDARNVIEELERDKASKSELDTISDKIDSQLSRLDDVDRIYKSLLEELISERENGNFLYSFENVTLAKGEKAVLSGGGDIMLRQGSGSYVFDGADAFDNTAKLSLQSGNEAPNGHIVSFGGLAYFEASSDFTTIMIRGEWKIER